MIVGLQLHGGPCDGVDVDPGWCQSSTVFTTNPDDPQLLTHRYAADTGEYIGILHDPLDDMPAYDDEEV